ncbi:MAG: SEC-C domain-containing protein [Gemmatimonadaceae bacterium]
MTQLSRNDLCSCGSGKKHKRCCGSTNVAGQAPEVARANAAKELDRGLVAPLMRFARLRFGPDWLDSAMREYVGSDETIEQVEMQLAVPWALFHYPATEGDLPVARLFGDERRRRLSPELRAILDAQLQAWLGVWEVQRVEEGVGMALKDLLTGEERFVHEISGSRGVGTRDALLGRVVDSGGVSFLGGVHPQPLPPRDADIAVREVRRACRVRTRPVRVEKLRQTAVQLLTIDVWRDLAAQLREPRPMPTLTNTDGDPIVMTTDHFDIVTPDGATVIARLATFAGAEEPEYDENGETTITIIKPGNAKMKSWDNTIIGHIVIAGRRMRVESNSVRRADDLRRELASHLGELVRHRLRDETGAEELFASAQRSSPRGKSDRRREEAPEFKALAREFKERHMTAWVDEAIPALGGLTPREASKSPRTRKDLDLLLRELENRESRLPADERFDVGRLRAELGI